MTIAPEPECPVCHASASETLDFRAEVPVAQNLIFKSREEAVACPTASLRVERCMACGFAWNAEFDPRVIVYNADYENDQSHSPAFRQHLDAVIETVGSRMAGAGGLDALEIGCGQGGFLHRLANCLGPRLRSLTGFDPALRANGDLPAGALVEADYFTEQTRARLAGKPNLIVSRHVIEHVADPIGFLRTVRSACAEGAVLFIETPNLQWILDGAVVHDLYYEHCSLFDAPSLALALSSAGFEVEEISPGFGGQYLLATARAAAPGGRPERSSPADNCDYAERKQGYVDSLAAAFRRDSDAGAKTALWGGASKGVTLALLLRGCSAGPELAIDINPARAGTFMPLTGLPVVSPEMARQQGITAAYVMNPAYLPEIERSCAERQWPLQLRSAEPAVPAPSCRPRRPSPIRRSPA